MVDGQVLSLLLQQKLDCKFKRVREYKGPLAQKNTTYFINFCDGIAKGVVNGSLVINFHTADIGIGGTPPVQGKGEGIGIIIDVPYFVEHLYTELRDKIIDSHKRTVYPAWCPEPFKYSPIIGTWRKGSNTNGVDLTFEGPSYTAKGVGSDTTASSGSYSWESKSGSFNRCVNSSSGWDFPNAGRTSVIVSGNVLEVYSGNELVNTFQRTTPAPGRTPADHCSLKPNQYNKYNFLTALCEGIAESIAEHYENFRQLKSTHPMVYLGQGEIKNGMFYGIAESDVDNMIQTEGNLMKGSFWPKLSAAVAKVYTDVIHNKSTGEVVITGTCAPSSSQTCGMPMIGIGNGEAT